MSSGSSKVDEGTSLVHLQEDIKIIKEHIKDIIFNNRSLKKRISELTRENEDLHDCIYNNEVNISNLDQYSRRSNVEIKNISEKVNQGNIENYVLKLFESIGTKLVSHDLVAVHRIGKLVSYDLVAVHRIGKLVSYDLVAVHRIGKLVSYDLVAVHRIGKLVSYDLVAVHRIGKYIHGKNRNVFLFL